MNTDGHRLKTLGRDDIVGGTVTGVYTSSQTLDEGWLDYVETFLALDSGVITRMADEDFPFVAQDQLPENAGDIASSLPLHDAKITGVFIRQGYADEVLLKLDNGHWLHVIRSAPAETGAAGVYCPGDDEVGQSDLVDFWSARLP